MLKKIGIFLFVSIIFMSTAFAESADDYDWERVYDFQARKLLEVHNPKGEWDHSIFYFAEGDNKCLVLISHGLVDKNGNYLVHLQNTNRYDYQTAVAETIAYWTAKGKLQNVEFDYVFYSTCYSGYAQKTSTLPIFDMNLQMAIDHKGVTGFAEKYDNNGNVIGVILYRGYEKSPRALSKSVSNSGSSGGSNKNFVDRSESVNIKIS